MTKHLVSSRFPDLSRTGLILGYSLKNDVYTTPVDPDMDLVVKLVCATADIQKYPGVSERVHQSKVRRYNECIVSNGGNFKHLL